MRSCRKQTGLLWDQLLSPHGASHSLGAIPCADGGPEGLWTHSFLLQEEMEVVEKNPAGKMEILQEHRVTG